MQKVPDGANMVGQFFRKGQRLAYEPRTTLPQGIVEALNVSGLAGFFAHRFVAFGGQNARIDLIEIGKTNRLLAIFWREGIPQIFGSRLIARSDSAPNDQACIDIQG